MQKAFLSFSGLMYQLIHEAITESDLDDGLFYFWCTRIMALGMTPEDALSNVIETESPNYKKAVLLLTQVLRPALRLAEKEGRIAWRKKDEQPTCQQFETLLVQNGVSPTRARTAREQREYEQVQAVFMGLPDIVEAFGNYPLEFVV